MARFGMPVVPDGLIIGTCRPDMFTIRSFLLSWPISLVEVVLNSAV